MGNLIANNFHQWKFSKNKSFKIASLQSQIDKSMGGDSTLWRWFFSIVVHAEFIGVCLFGCKAGFIRKKPKSTPRLRYYIVNRTPDGICMAIRTAAPVNIEKDKDVIKMKAVNAIPFTQKICDSLK